jgi:peptidoglycan/xylan/chitin deacetylase (PgdA/CDA1 family)
MSINRRNAILTFDYEVFLGSQTGTTENCVIRPVQSVLDILKKNNAKAIFFTDAAWLLFLKENYLKDFKIVAEQLEFICKSGSSVELHLHPQWLDAYIVEGRIGFKSYDNYRLHSLDNESIVNLFSKSSDLLESITGQKISCFRAGGWCIEPFSKINEAFEKVNIKYDFSVVPGARVNEGKVYDFDFSDAPAIPFYSFTSNVCAPEKEGRFVEFPLSTYKNNVLYRIINKALLILKNDKIYGDGVGVKEKSVKSTLAGLFRFSKGMLSLDKLHTIVFRYLIASSFKGKDLLVIVSHPKTFSKQALINLDFITHNFNTLNTNDLANLIINYQHKE